MMNEKQKSVAKQNSGIAECCGFIKKFIDDILEDEVGLYAAQATFFIVLSTVPFIMLLILGLKYIIDVDLAEVARTFDRILPQQLSVFLTDIISEVFYRSESATLFSGVFISLLWSSSKGTMAISGGLNKIYGKIRNESWLRMRIYSFFYNVLFLAIIIASIVVLLFGKAIVNFLDSEFLVAHYVISVVMRFRTLIFFVLFLLAFAAMFTFLPQKKNKYGGQLWGAAATAVGWLLASYGISIYISYFPGVSYIYGSLTAIMLLMLWLFFCMYALLIGAEINKHIETGYFKRVGMRLKRQYVKKRKKRRKNT